MIIYVFALTLLCCLSVLSTLNAHVYHRYDQRLEDAIYFINQVQSPTNCTGIDYLVVGIGINGGFAAQFQLAAKEWMHLFAAYNFSVPVLVEGDFI